MHALKLLPPILGLAFLFASTLSHGQQGKVPAGVYVGWLTYDGTTAQSHFKDCADDKLLRIWQSQKAIDSLLAMARQEGAAYRMTGNSILVHATIQAEPYHSAIHCKYNNVEKGCAILIKAIEIRKTNPRSICTPR